jgi:hypothetical protein
VRAEIVRASARVAFPEGIGPSVYFPFEITEKDMGLEGVIPVYKIHGNHMEACVACYLGTFLFARDKFGDTMY